MQTLIINYIHIQDKSKYRFKDLVKCVEPKFVIDYASILDKQFYEEDLMIDKELLISSLIIKKLTKLLENAMRNESRDTLTLYYALSEITAKKIINLTTIINGIYTGVIINNIHTDMLTFDKSIFNMCGTLSNLKCYIKK